MDTKQLNRDELKELICDCVEQNQYCPSMLEIQDIDFRVVRIEQKLDSIIRFLKRQVKPVLEDMSEETKQ